jgi:hypothetical protein
LQHFPQLGINFNSIAHLCIQENFARFQKEVAKFLATIQLIDA